MEILKTRRYDDWNKLVDDLTELHSQDSFIFRGQSNYGRIGDKNEWEKWEIVSSFNRHYGILEYSFSTFLLQQLSNFKQFYSNYKYSEIENIKDYSTIELLYFFQHYGIPTCLIDFTYDPLVALYFAISGVKLSSVAQYDPFSGKSTLFSDNFFVSIYAVNYKFLLDSLNVKTLNPNNLIHNYNSDYKIGACNIALDHKPLSNCRSDSIFNLKNQEGCFILFDNNGSDLGLVEFFYERINSSRSEIKVENYLVYEFQLGYNSVVRPYFLKEDNEISIFNYLDKNGKTGRHLFNDLQGIKYDLNFFHNQ